MKILRLFHEEELQRVFVSTEKLRQEREEAGGPASISVGVLGFTVQGLGNFGVLRFRAQGLRNIGILRFRVQGLGHSGFYGLGFRV